MDRVFVPASCFTPEEARIEGGTRRHLADSLRLRSGDRFLATDGEGNEYDLEAGEVGRRTIVARVIEKRSRPAGVGDSLTLAIAPPKGNRMEIAIEKAVECGVGAIVPLVASRSVVKGRDDSERVERWRRVARSATAQSGRFRAPVIGEVRDLNDFLPEAVARGPALLAHPGLTASTVAAALADRPAGTAVTLLVGPEGGFTDAEVEEGRRAGATEVTLGPNRLRSETAAIVAVTLALAVLEQSR